jgi:hypothetical protein
MEGSEDLMNKPIGGLSSLLNLVPEWKEDGSPNYRKFADGGG